VVVRGGGELPASIYWLGEAVGGPGGARGPRAAGGDVISALPATGRERRI
jgi:hypothetical protein